MHRSKWDSWAAFFWIVAVLTVPLSIYMVYEIGYTRVPLASGFYGTRSVLNIGVVASAVFLAVGAFFAAALFSLINDIYKSSAAADTSPQSSAQPSSANVAGALVVGVDKGSPLEGKVESGWRLVSVNGSVIHRRDDVLKALCAGKNQLRFLKPDSGVEGAEIDLTSPPNLGISLS